MSDFPRWYRLEGRTPVRVFGPEEATMPGGNQIARTRVGACDVSTIFLPFDHAWDDGPLLFETIIFGGPIDGEYSMRYSDIDAAEAGHLAACAFAREQQSWLATFRRWLARIREAMRGGWR